LIAVAGGTSLAVLGPGPPIVLYLVLDGTILLLALLSERGRYRPSRRVAPGKKRTSVFVDKHRPVDEWFATILEPEPGST
jgi:hypothetical protein